MRKALVVAVLIGLLVGAGLVASAEQFKVGINNFGQANFFGRIGRTVLINTVEALGGKAISTVANDYTERLASIENFMAQGVDAIIIQEGDIKLSAPILEEAKRQGILIASMDAGTAPFVDLVVESNNWVMGAMAATALMNATGGVANIVLITNPLGQMIRMRAGELQLVLTEYTQSQIIGEIVYAWPDFFPDIKSKMESILIANPTPESVNAVFATFDGAAVAAASAIREAGRQSQFAIVGVDGDPQAYEEMSKPDSPMVATVAQQPALMAETLVKQVFTLLTGGVVPVRHTYIESALVTKDGLPPQSEWPYAENFVDYGKDATL